ncbi:reverse transcriptase domain-containing protein [Tanacetum coccineum]
MIKAGKLSQFIKELKQNDKPKAPKKGEAAGKERPLAILMIQPWERVPKQKATQSFSPETTISFPPLGDKDGTEGPMIIEAEIGGHFVHRIFSGETIWPLGQISLLVKIGDEEHSTSAWMNFMVVRQKKRGQAPERNKAIQEEVEKFQRSKQSMSSGWLSTAGDRLESRIPLRIPLHITKDSKGSRAQLGGICQATGHKKAVRKKKLSRHSITFQNSPKINYEAGIQKNAPSGCKRGCSWAKSECDGLKVCTDKADAVLSLPSRDASRCETLNGETSQFNSCGQGKHQCSVNDREEKANKYPSTLEPLLRGGVNYNPMEKLVLTLLSASRRLKRYFQAYAIIVITDQPIKQLLSNSETSGRMLKWKFELEGYDIQYRPRASIKGQILSGI